MSIEPWVNCRDIQKSLRFYTEILDFEILMPSETVQSAFNSKHSLLIREGECVHLSSHGDGPYGGGFYVRVENIDSLFEKYVANGLNVEDFDSVPGLKGGPVDQSWGMREFWINDPDKNKVIFGQELNK